MGRNALWSAATVAESNRFNSRDKDWREKRGTRNFELHFTKRSLHESQVKCR